MTAFLSKNSPVITSALWETEARQAKPAPETVNRKLWREKLKKKTIKIQFVMKKKKKK